MTNQRKHRRVDCDVRGEIAIDSAPTGIECLVRDFSFRGANLEFPHATAVPDRDEFDIMISAEQWHFRATRIWQRGDRVGVRLVPVPAPDH